FLFLGVAIEDCGVITRSNICELAVGLGGIDLAPIDVEKLVVGNLRRVVGDFDRFAILCFFRRHELVSRVWLRAAAIAHHGFDNALRFVECRLNAPKTSTGENRGLGSRWSGTLPITRGRKRQTDKKEKNNSIHVVSFMSLWT